MTGSNFSVVSWNVNSINSRLTLLQELLSTKKPNAVCLQELKCTEEKFPYSEIRDLGYHSAVHGQKTYNGVALLSRTPITKITYGFDGKKSESSARLIGGKIGNLNLYSVYVPNGQEVGSEKYMEKLAFLKAFRTYLQENHTPSDLVVLGGDFNIAADERDVHDPDQWRGHLLFSDRERKALTLFAHENWTDAYRAFLPKGRDFSWWDYRSGAFQRNAGLRIDLIYLSQSLRPLLKDAGVYSEFRKKDKPSDHAPVYGTLLLSEKFFGHE